MGALRKPAPVYQPTQIIILPLNQAKPSVSEELTWWDRFSTSEFGDLVLFEIKAFACAGLAFAVLGAALAGLYSAQSSNSGRLVTGPDTGFLSDLASPENVRLPHQLN